MKKCFPTILLCLFGTFLNAIDIKSESKDIANEPVEIRVLIQEMVEGALVDLQGGYIVRNPENNKRLSYAFSGKRYYLQTSPHGIKWGENFYGIHQIRITPKKNNTSILVDGIQYKGALSAYDVNGKIFLINELDVEDYLKSILSKKYGNQSLKEATLDAISIVARTNLYYEISKRSNPYWDLRSTENDYQGYAMAYISPEINRAITATKGIVLLYKQTPFPTACTEHSGGQTASYQSIFRKTSEGPSGTLVPFAKKKRGESHWKSSFSKAELGEKFDLANITSIELFQDNASKKVYGLRLYNDKKFVETTFQDFRTKLGNARIKSNDFSVHIVKETIVFEGYGEGHGVGLCIFSADSMAKQGSNAPQILSNFFPETRLIKMTGMPSTNIEE